MFKYLLLCLFLVSTSWAQERSAQSLTGEISNKPKLVVLISIDQFRYDYLVRFKSYFVEDGFNRLLDHGLDYTNCHYQYAVTKTGPGHATIVTGVNANIHGICGNDWLDRNDWHQMNCVEDETSALVGASKSTPHAPGGKLLESRTGRSPRNLLVNTLGDELKLAYGESSHVVSISNKDRAAILMGGKKANAAYWVENDRFISSKYYMSELPKWAIDFNERHLITNYFGKTWDRLLPEKEYVKVQGPDDAPGEVDFQGLGKVFPRKVTGTDGYVGPSFYDAFDVTPFSSDVIELFVQEAIEKENLGKHSTPDMLCVGFSQIDFVGHAYGVDSHELMDCVLRLDRSIARLFSFLDSHVGLDHCLIVLTADHGASPAPERVTDLEAKKTASRLNNALLDKTVQSALVKAFGEPPMNDFWVKRDNFGYTLHPSALKAKGISQIKAEEVIKQSLLTLPQIFTAYTSLELSQLPSGDSLLAKSQRSYFQGRSSDVVYIIKPYVVDKTIAGTNHGTPWEYDTHVPQLWYGAGIKPEVSTQSVTVEDIVPTLANLLGLKMPIYAIGKKLF
jgi:predicted AlkP superfamily pyrophosphatase or phosphodiesterase